ncbi:ABC transporter permease [Mucilaginibacter myungsuensis]|uniref:ABC transporter permease n=1 Tax=Mucilaginibacter myungsuensis TaxID=649104 RepID=A0A929L7D1_9SPHI|nr:ABC transporter permease [Mucilaginibacter myungsuensis]MBE9664531.1 ABC transporter permease [Mucilaginibacter myungsuensis]MDN3601324.1 ABC transporter permease [Mucilaginibacter myungsuensis]
MIFFKLFRESFLFAYDALRQNKLRTTLSLLGVTIGIFTIIAVFSAVDTLHNNLQSSIDKLGDNSVYVSKMPWIMDGNSPWWKFIQRPTTNLREFEKLKQRSQTAAGVTYQLGLANRTVKFQSNFVENVDISAASADYHITRNFDIQDGRYFTDGESRTGAPVVLIGASVSEGLFPHLQPIGQRIKVMGRYVTIIGVFAKEGENMMGITSDEMILMPLNYARNLVDVQSDRYGPEITVKGKAGISLIEVSSELRGLMRSIRRLGPAQEDNFALNESTILTQGFDQLFGIVNIAGWIIGGFSILVGGFGIANIMFVSVKERTNIIGIQKSLGAKNYFILLQFLLEAVALCLLGGLIGLGLVYLGTIGVKAGTDIEIVLDLTNMMRGITISVVIGIISGIVPAWSASRMDPVEAIRTN